MFCDCMGYHFFIFGIPVYLKKVHGLSTETVINAFVMESPCVKNNYFPSPIADWLCDSNTFLYCICVLTDICDVCRLACHNSQAFCYAHQKTGKSFLSDRNSCRISWSLLCWLQLCLGSSIDCLHGHCQFYCHVRVLGKTHSSKDGSFKSTYQVTISTQQLYFMDISPNFSAILYGVANALAATTGLIDSSMLGYLIEGVVSFHATKVTHC